MDTNNNLHPTCNLSGWFKDRDSSDIFNFTEPKPAEEIEAGVFAFTMDIVEILEDGTERPASLTGFAVEFPDGDELMVSNVLPLKCNS